MLSGLRKALSRATMGSVRISIANKKEMASPTDRILGMNDRLTR